MLFVDYLGPAHRFEQVREVTCRELAAAMRMPAAGVVVRRIVVDPPGDAVELWIELSSEEQRYRLGQHIAQRISTVLRASDDPVDVWVMYRVVPLSHAFLNGEARGRGTFE